MATLRLFASARDAAGTGQIDLPGATVDDVVATAIDQFGTHFSDVVAISKIWLNGEPTIGGARVVDSDEIAILPPVSGGCR